MVDAETEARRAAVTAALKRAIEGLTAEDAVIVRMRMWQAMSVADIARALHLPQKPLYRRVDRIYAELRRTLEAGGIDLQDVRDLLQPGDDPG